MGAGDWKIRTWLWRFAGVTLLVVLGACRAIAGVHGLIYEEADGACQAPSLPTQGNGRARLVNAGTQGESVDFCIRASGSSDWGKPLLSAGNASCSSGLAYAEVTVPFAVPAGSVDVEAIPSGSSCESGATAQATAIPVGDTTAGASVMTLVRYGGGTNPEHIVALPEEPPGANGPFNYALRVVNAISSGQPINMGPAASSSLPTTASEILFHQAIQPGGVEPQFNVVPLLRSVDAEGYCSPPPSPASFAVVFQNEHDALFTFQTPSNPDVQTLFAIGDYADATRPIRGLLCEDAADATGNTPLVASCQLSALPSLAVDTFNTSLYGAEAPFNDERRSAVYDAIAGRPSDAMCVVETALDVDAIVQNAKGNFPYSYFVRTDLDTQPTDPTDAKGATPPPPAGPPCAGIDPNIVESIYQCLGGAGGCSNTGDASGNIETSNCISDACASQVLPLYYQGRQQDTCIDCILYYAVSELPLAVGQQACTGDPRQPFAYQGMNGTLILSRYPLAGTKAFILPSTGFRRAVLYAQLQLEDQVVDFFCGELSSPLIDGELPYVGNYGDDIPNEENGWEDEQDLQAQRMIAWIRATAQHPAIIAGDWHATSAFGIPAPDGGTTPVLDSQSPEVMTMLDQSLGGAFVAAEPPDYQPSCEYCPAPTNIYNAGNGILPEDFTRMYLMGFASSATIEDSLWGMDNTVPLTSITDEPAPASFGPLSTYYGRLVRVLRPPLPGH